MDMKRLFENAPQNPYIFASLVVLAIISAWQPLSRIAYAAWFFYSDVIHQGLRRAIQRIFEYAERKSSRIVADNSKGTMILVLDLSWSIRMALNSIFMFLMAITILALPAETASDFLVKKYFPIFVFLIAALSALVWFVDSFLQSLVFVMIRKKLRASTDSHDVSEA